MLLALPSGAQAENLAGVGERVGRAGQETAQVGPFSWGRDLGVGEPGVVVDNH
jgi:hypothetical protein